MIKNVFPLIALSALLLASCNLGFEDESQNEPEIIDAEDNILEADENNSEDFEESGDYTWSSSSEVEITLNGSSISVNGDGATADGSVLTINAAGNYNISGTLNDGQIIVDSEDEEIVRIILNGVNITCSNSAPIFIKNAPKVILALADDTENFITDGVSYITDDGEPNAAIFSKENMAIFGDGSLTVDANYNDGIASKDGLIIKSGTVIVDAADDGIRGKDFLIVKGGTMDIIAGGDGLKSDNETDSTCGYVSVIDGKINVTASGDAIQAETDVLITYGEFSLTSGGGSSHSVTSSSTAKGIKAGVEVIVEDGLFTINSADDALHSNVSLTINYGEFTISTGDDAIHADSYLLINDGIIQISKSYEGIESKIVQIAGGDIHLISSDDGINAASGTGGGGFPGGGFSVSSNNFFYLDGGYVYVNANGDGIDINGAVAITGGTLIVNGPTSSGNGALDYDGSFEMNGGYILAAGSSGMAQVPGSSSDQNSVLIYFSSTLSAGTLVHLEASDGTSLFTFKPAKTYQSVAFSSSDLKQGATYTIYTGGSSTGTEVDGLYTGGTYSGGSEYTSFTISSTVTQVGSGGGHPPGW
ncbi:carbohydrate-binding domain-containing protein [Sunxiuqinia sp. A32]|uniref:carbohydrate-binding domain-containing protein n=1 Tax=Sunxiuqinia sp. A32 TaxID=3461496 RepID=UPI0040458580